MGNTTLEMANKMLSLVRPITEDIIKNWRAIQEASEELSTAEDEKAELLHRIFKLTKELNDNIDELESIGCMVDNYETGAIDFRSELEGEEIRLCWTLGEEEILHYHRPGETIRQRLLLKERLE